MCVCIYIYTYIYSDTHGYIYIYILVCSLLYVKALEKHIDTNIYKIVFTCINANVRKQRNNGETEKAIWILRRQSKRDRICRQRNVYVEVLLDTNKSLLNLACSRIFLFYEREWVILYLPVFLFLFQKQTYSHQKKNKQT